MERKSNIIFFDDSCKLCNGAVRFLVKHDRKSRFKFSGTQSCQRYLSLNKKEVLNEFQQTIVYLRNNKYLTHSDALLYILRDIGGIWSYFFVFIIIPGSVRNIFYNLVARNRYRFRGGNKSCNVNIAESENVFQ